MKRTVKAGWFFVSGIKVKETFTQERFGSLVTIGPQFITSRRPKVVAECDCGSVVVVRYGHLGKGIKSCGCRKGKDKTKKPLEGWSRCSGVRICNEHEPKRFRRLVTIGPAFFAGGDQWQVVQCDCGVAIVAKVCRLGKPTISCGCHNREVTIKRQYRHGHASYGKRTTEYMVWDGMKSRCANPNYEGWSRYGGRGIKVCERWAESFENFYADMGPRPSANHTPDRIDNDGNYEPSNCRWASHEVQANNRHNNLRLTFAGKTQTLSQWSRETGIHFETLRARLNHGWSPDDIITKKPQYKSRRK
jgi:hypothetical protein